MHGSTFADVLNHLSHKEVGMATDDCHPRFIACMLRLGDLLDLDDNRFCSIMQRIAGDDRPIISLAHEDKHRSIRNLRLNSDRIEIKAVCETVDGYVEQWRWLDYLKEEIQNQMARWLDIAPSSDLGLLPTLGEINVEIAGRQLITKPGKRQEFTLNSARVMTLLRGENIYQREDVVRELLQNAVDATLLRVWLTSQCDQKIIGNKPDGTSNDYFKRFPISVLLERIENLDVPVNPGSILWRFTVVDQGIGIGQTDLPYMMNVAGSSANIKRQMVIDSMPEWMQPSGTFGIGLQSVFMRTDEVQIKTKCFYTHEAMDITLHSPTGPRRGLVTVEREENSFMCPMGTTLSFTMITDSSPYGHFIENDGGLTSQALHSYDPLLDKEMSLDAWKIIDAANKFAGHSLIPVKWIFKNGDDQVFSNEEPDNTNDAADDFYLETNSKFYMEICPDYRRSLRSELYYRGQEVKEAKPDSYLFINYRLDLFSGKAGDWLTFDRNGLASEGRKKIPQLVRKNIHLWTERNKDSLIIEQKAALSLIAKLWSTDHERDGDSAFWFSLSNEIPDDWLDLPCKITKNGNFEVVTYREALKLDTEFCSAYHQSEKIASQDACIAFVDDIICRMIVDQWCRNQSNGIKYILRNTTIHSISNKLLFVKLVKAISNTNRIDVDKESLMAAIEMKVRTIDWIERLLLPIELFPTEMKIGCLELKENTKISGARYCFEYVPVPLPHVLLPFEIQYRFRGKRKCTLDRFDEFIDWVYEHLKNPVSREDTKSVYLGIIDYIDNTVMQNSDKWKELRGEFK